MTAKRVGSILPPNGGTGNQGEPGPPGPPGPARDYGEQYSYAGPLSSINQNHLLGRIPAVCVFINGEMVGINVSANATNVFIEFPKPFYNIQIILT